LLCATCVLYKHQATSSLNSRVGKNNFATIILPVFPNFLIVVTASREKTGRWFMQEFGLSWVSNRVVGVPGYVQQSKKMKMQAVSAFVLALVAASFFSGYAQAQPAAPLWPEVWSSAFSEV
jgi:hypothetical protein